MSGDFTVELADDWDADSFVPVSRHLVRDKALSMKARGLAAWLASHQRGFTMTRAYIIGAGSDGRDSIEAGLRELREGGYLTVVRARGEDGRLSGAARYQLHKFPIPRESSDGETRNVVETCVRVSQDLDNPESGSPATKRTSTKENKFESIGATAPNDTTLALFEASPPVPVAKPKRAKKAGHVMPEDWKPSESARTTAREARLDLDFESAQFRDHHAAKGSKMVDWDRAFQTWLRNSIKWTRERNVQRGVTVDPEVDLNELNEWGKPKFYPSGKVIIYNRYGLEQQV